MEVAPLAPGESGTWFFPSALALGPPRGHTHTHTGPCVIQPLCEVGKAGLGREVREVDIKRTQASRTATLDLAL